MARKPRRRKRQAPELAPASTPSDARAIVTGPTTLRRPDPRPFLSSDTPYPAADSLAPAPVFDNAAVRAGLARLRAATRAARTAGHRLPDPNGFMPAPLNADELRHQREDRS
jgi:hypothetical protein